MKREKALSLEEKMIQVNRKLEEFLLTDAGHMQEIMEWQLQAKGKQIRPKLMLLAASFGKWKPHIIEFAAALEILHMASLVHDDIVDNAQQRRGADSVQFHFGQSAAIYAGDYMVFCVLAQISRFPRKLQYNLYQSLTQLCSGEVMQFHNLHNARITEQEYLQQIQGKTAALFEIACSVGAIESGCRPRQVKALTEYGRNLGMMFQIQDDLLDFMGAKTMGKKTQSDLGQGVYTLPVIYALAQPEVGQQLEALLQAYRNTPQEAAYNQIAELVIRGGGVAYTMQRLQEYYDEARQAMKCLPNTEEKQRMTDLLDKIRHAAIQATGGTACIAS